MRIGEPHSLTQNISNVGNQLLLGNYGMLMPNCQIKKKERK